MINNNEKLIVLDNFKIDTKLPKYKNKDNNNFINNDVNGDSNGDDIFIRDGNIFVNDLITSSVSYISYLEEQLKRTNINIIKKIKFSFLFLFSKYILNSTKKKDITVTKRTKISIEEFFTTIKNSKMNINITHDILNKYETVLKEAHKNGQVALTEKLIKLKDVIASEAKLIENGITKYVTEKQVVNFYKNTDKEKKLKLTYLENYVRIIPSDIIKLKDKADEIEVFDNYVILHFDPLNNSTNLTEKEKVEQKPIDPILFGIIKNSRNLYFIGDWIDEYCDLTLEKMLETLNEKDYNLTNESVISYINNI